jgi:hypothetical protein
MKSKTKKVLIATRIDASVNSAIKNHCKKTGVSKQFAIEKPLAEAYIMQGKNFTYTKS